jgi:NAD kinase
VGCSSSLQAIVEGPPEAGVRWFSNRGRRDGKSQALRAYQRRTLAADALVAGCYLAGTNTRWLLGALFGSAAGKDTVSRGGGQGFALRTVRTLARCAIPALGRIPGAHLGKLVEN